MPSVIPENIKPPAPKAWSRRSECIMDVQEQVPSMQTNGFQQVKTTHTIHTSDICAYHLHRKEKTGAKNCTGDRSIPKLIDEIPYPSLAGTDFEHISSKPTVMLKQAVLLAQIHRPSKPSQKTFQWYFLVDSSYSGGTAPAYTGFPIKSCDTCSLPYLIFMVSLVLSLIRHTAFVNTF